MRQIVQMCRSQGSEADGPTLLGEVARSLGVRPAAPPPPNLSDPALYLDFCSLTLECVAFPRKSKRHMAFGSGVGAKGHAWKWICDQIAESAIHPAWIHRALLCHLGVLLAELFRKIGGCRLPICIGPSEAMQLVSCGNAITDLRIQENGRAMDSSDPAL